MMHGHRVCFSAHKHSSLLHVPERGSVVQFPENGVDPVGEVRSFLIERTEKGPLRFGEPFFLRSFNGKHLGVDSHGRICTTGERYGLEQHFSLAPGSSSQKRLLTRGSAVPSATVARLRYRVKKERGEFEWQLAQVIDGCLEVKNTANNSKDQLLDVATDTVLTDAVLRVKVALKAAIDEGLRVGRLCRGRQNNLEVTQSDLVRKRLIGIR